MIPGRGTAAHNALDQGKFPTCTESGEDPDFFRNQSSVWENESVMNGSRFSGAHDDRLPDIVMTDPGLYGIQHSSALNGLTKSKVGFYAEGKMGSLEHKSLSSPKENVIVRQEVLMGQCLLPRVDVSTILAYSHPQITPMTSRSVDCTDTISTDGDQHELSPMPVATISDCVKPARGVWAPSRG